MAYAIGHEWTRAKLKRLETLLIGGFKTSMICETLTREFGINISVQMVHQAKYRHSLTRHMVEIDEQITYYADEGIPNGNYIVFSDAHAPYYDEVYLNRLLAIADKFKIRRAVSGGDTLDQDFAKFFYDAEKGDLDTEIIKTEPLLLALQYFDKVYFIRGNHEDRVGRMTDGKIQARHIFKLFGEKVWNEKFEYVDRTRINIGEKWMVVHPRNYSQVSGSVAVRLAEKYHRHIINAHGHFIAFRFDRSGEYMAIDLGGLFKHEKMKYKSDSTTTHPEWNPGFGMICNEHFYHFHEGTDWKYWLGA